MEADESDFLFDKLRKTCVAHDMVAIPAYENDERRSRKRQKMEASVLEHNRGNVWDKMATCWAGEEDWMLAREKQQSQSINLHVELNEGH